MFVYTKQEDSYKEHEHLLAMEQEMLGKVEVPYRIIDTAAGDLGSSAARKFDCEAWVPTQGRYRELTSTSNCTEYQARRLNIRERMEDGGTRAVSTLNGTLARKSSSRPSGKPDRIWVCLAESDSLGCSWSLVTRVCLSVPLSC